LLIKNKKVKKNRKPSIPTEEEFLKFLPVQSDFKWSTDKNNLIHIEVPKFKSNIGISFCKLIKKENIFTANLDKIGSIVWKNCDGKKSVKDILDIVKKEFPNEKNIEQRLYLFIQQMHALNYIKL